MTRSGISDNNRSVSKVISVYFLEMRWTVYRTSMVSKRLERNSCGPKGVAVLSVENPCDKIKVG